jgi:hypothetical protein
MSCPFVDSCYTALDPGLGNSGGAEKTVGASTAGPCGTTSEWKAVRVFRFWVGKGMYHAHNVAAEKESDRR